MLGTERRACCDRRCCSSTFLPGTSGEGGFFGTGVGGDHGEQGDTLLPTFQGMLAPADLGRKVTVYVNGFQQLLPLPLDPFCLFQFEILLPHIFCQQPVSPRPQLEQTGVAALCLCALIVRIESLLLHREGCEVSL